MSVYEYQAPQFVDFDTGLDDSDEADKFFDVEQDTPLKEENKENSPRNQPLSNNDGEQDKRRTECTITNEIKSVSKTPKELERTNNKRREILKAVRRISEIKIEDKTSSSENLVNQIKVEDNLSQDLSRVSLKSRKRTHFEGIELKTDNEKQHVMVTRNDEKIKTPKMELRTRSVNKNDDPSCNRKRKSEEMFVEAKNNIPKKYVALAEHILHYQKDTPPRFHSHKHQSEGMNGFLWKKRQSYKPRRTIALTPKLMTAARSRPVDAPSQQQREEIELEDIKKHQIKANPLNEKIFLTPKLPPKQEKPITTPAPFNITEVFKKPTKVVEEEPYKFTAKPVPKVILEKPVGIAPKKELPLTIPESPAITKPSWAYKRVKVATISNEFKERTEDVTSFGVPMPELPKRTEVKPFSFEVRDKQMLEKKDKKLKEIMETEKKLREFKANPVPSFVRGGTRSSMRHSTFNCSKASVNNESEEASKPFKARSPRVLRKEPFRPVTEGAHTEPLDIQLHTDRRVVERQGFEEKQLEKEMQQTYLRKWIEQANKYKEELEVAKMRKETVHKPLPMPKFKPVPLNEKVVSNQPLTNPQSPRFTKRTRTSTLCSSNLKQK